MGFLTNLQRASVPNIPVLRHLVRWFDEVSEALDNGGVLVAAAVVDGGANVQRSFGLLEPVIVAHPSTGNFIMEFATAQDPNLLYPMANIYSPTSPPAGAINIYPTIPDANHVSVAIWQIAMTTAARAQVDEQFVITVMRMPTP